MDFVAFFVIMGTLILKHAETQGSRGTANLIKFDVIIIVSSILITTYYYYPQDEGLSRRDNPSSCEGMARRAITETGASNPLVPGDFLVITTVTSYAYFY